MTSQQCEIEKSNIAVSRGKSRSLTGDHVRNVRLTLAMTREMIILDTDWYSLMFCLFMSR